MTPIATDHSIVVTFVAYLFILFAVGYLGWRRTHTLSDYVLGGRSLGPWVTALSAGASDMSGWLLLGLPGYAYASGLEALWLVAGLWLGTYLNWRFVAQRLRELSHQLDVLTIPDYLTARFNDTGRLLKVISALCIIMFFTFYTASGLVAGGKLFNSVFGMPYLWAVTAGATVIVVYTLIGGFLAVSWTDFLQGSLMLFALILVPVLAFSEAGNTLPDSHIFEALNPDLLDMFTDKAGMDLTVIAIVSLMAWGLGYFGQPHILARFMAIHSPDKLRQARHIAMSWVSLSMLGAVMAGLAGILLFGDALQADGERVLIELIGRLLQPIPAGICLAAILAAIMSTADSQLLVASASLADDLYKSCWKTSASDRELVWVGRLGVIVLAVIAAVIARDPDSSVLNMVAYAWAGFGAAFGPVILFSLFSQSMTRLQAAVGMLTGAITVVVWKQLGHGIFTVYELLPGFVMASMAILFTGLVTRNQPLPQR